MRLAPAAWSKFWRLPRPERRVLLTAIILLPVTRIGLRAFGLRKTQSWLMRGPALVDKPYSNVGAGRAAELVDIASRRAFFESTCLARSLVLGRILRGLGVANALRIGVRVTEGALNAHAWIECAGVPLNDLADIGESFAPFGEIIPNEAFQSR